ncbi:MAG: nucleotide-binding protein [Euryarchaeota archaeon]|nr:nucleotide-binding protein [Euryarchaeota archaeon]
MAKRIVVLDSNFLMIPAQFKVDIFKETERLLPVAYELVVLSPILDELKRIKESSKKSLERKAADIALNLANNCRVIPLRTTKPIDELLIEYALNNKAVLCSNDKNLRKKAREIGIPVIYLRKKSHLELLGYI